MTAIVKTRSFEAPPQTRIGVILPGLGHLAVLEPIVGVGLLSLDLLLASSLAGSLHRGAIGDSVPAWAGLATMTGIAVLLGATAAVAHQLQTERMAPAQRWLEQTFGGPLRALYTVWALVSVLGGAWLLRMLLGKPLLATIHPSIAVTTWVALAAVVWWAGYRRAFPRVLSDEEYNSNHQLFLRTFGRNRTGMLGMFGVVFLIAATMLTPMIAPFDPNAIDMGPTSHAPGWAHLMGTDEYGRDVFSRVLYGGRISLSIGFIAAGIAATIGTTIGAIAAFFGGWVDRLLMYVVDMLLSLPRLVLLLAIVGMFRLNGVAAIFLIVVILGLTGWMGVSRIVRSQVLSLREQDFIQAARALGMGNARIVFRHLIPNALAPVIVYVTLAIGSTMLAEAGLSFLGLGVQPPTSTWGTMVNDGREPLRLAPWIATFPGLAIVAAVMSFNLLGDGLRDALDPKMRGQ